MATGALARFQAQSALTAFRGRSAVQTAERSTALLSGVALGALASGMLDNMGWATAGGLPIDGLIGGALFVAGLFYKGSHVVSGLLLGLAVGMLAPLLADMSAGLIDKVMS